jgi:hypothetical protein
MQGYRVSLKRPHDLYLDEVSVTTGYLGDLTTINVFKRFKWMNDHNYTQVFGAKKLSKTVALSADWSELNGDDTLREGVKLGTKQFGHVIDAVRFELYQRVDAAKTGNGAAFTVERAVNKTVSVNGGLANIDKNGNALNGDRYARGKRCFAGTTVTFLPELTLSAFYTHAFDNDFTVANNQRLDLILSYNVLKALQRHGLW